MKKQLKILLLEDDPTLTKLLQVTLEKKGHHVMLFANPTVCPVFTEHAEKCTTGKPCADVIITDQMMPYMTGLEFYQLQRERGCKAHDNNKALITGANITPEILKLIEDLGCKYFKKPFKVSDLVAWVDECSERVEDRH